MASGPFKARNGLHALDNSQVDGNLTISGTVDGRDVSADGTKLDGIAVNANKYVLPTASASTLGGIKVGSGLSIASGVLSATGGGDTVYTPDVWEVNNTTSITSDYNLAYAGTGNPTILNGTTGTTKAEGLDNVLEFGADGIYEVNYCVQLETQLTSNRQNPAVYAKAGTQGSTVPIDGSLNATYLRLDQTNGGFTNSVACTFYVNANANDHLELILTWTMAATTKNVDIVSHVAGLANTVSVRRIS